ncbi:MAG: hypothetical protein EOP88_14850 [Verrucomicrobiaceae bacterium]|nr:MAG: hypothetical protein EOP88_14850 [Verrucomicrobiaceae bacterium]
MHKGIQRRPPGRERDDGFTLVVCLMLLILLGVMAVGLVGLASMELRKSSQAGAQAEARANAKLALMEAIGQLQRTLGPDQRVSATAEILEGTVKQPHWTGVWKSTGEDGSSFFSRDDLQGGLRDRRAADARKPVERVMEWLVSGTGDPLADGPRGGIAIYQAEGVPVVSVPKISVKGAAGTTGHMAWWTGDLGVRANIGMTDPRSALVANRESPGDGGLFRMMVSQVADMALMEGGVKLPPETAERLVTPAMVSLAGVKKDWVRKHAFDFTTDSNGVLTNAAAGGLKQDLTSYFENGDVEAWKNLAGLSDRDSLVGLPPGQGAVTAVGTEMMQMESRPRHVAAEPRFGLLRDWARLGVPFSGKNVESRLAETDPAAGGASRERALANELPVKLAGQRVALQPILVEATNFTQMSTYQYQDTPKKMFQIRQLMYPRVVLWNPYNCELKFGRSILMLQGNGRQEMHTANENVNGLPWGPFTGQFRETTQWLNFEGGRSTVFTSAGGILDSEGYNDPYMGSYFFSIPETTFAPGECLVFSPPRAAEYDGLSVYRPGSYNLNANELSCAVAPDPSRCYYVSASDLDGGIDYRPKQFWYAPVTGTYAVPNQGDDSRAILKQVGNAGTIKFEDFDQLPQVAVLSASLQYGAGREPRIKWSGNEKMTMELLDKDHPQPTVVPNVRTREGIRLRWFQEHPSNTGSGALANTPYFDEAPLANWNPRAAFSMRSPWENVGGEGPWFFGAYTRDLFDQAVSWDEQVPVPRGGNYHGNPFGPPQEGCGKYVLFDVPRQETGLVSLGQLQHAKLSELIWHPSYAVGNSLADPRLGTGEFGGLDRTTALASNDESSDVGGFHEKDIGWSDDVKRAAGRDDWAATARAILGDLPERDNLVYDLSFEVNQTLWDRFYLSSGTKARKEAFLEDPDGKPLPNGRMRLSPFTRETADADSLSDFNRAAYQFMVRGAFNVNSTRVEAWKALLGSTRLTGYGSEGMTPFPRVLDPQEGAWQDGDSAEGDKAWAGYRELDEEEVGKLAEAIVKQVKKRGPFISMADFVNRRLAENETGRMGALQAAIEDAGLNKSLTDAWPLDNDSSLPNYSHPDHLADATRMEQTLKPDSKAWGAASYLTQADVLQVLGPALSARSDTFVVRAYGDSVDPSGKVRSRAWCEAVVQRTPVPVKPDESGLNCALAGTKEDFGRRFTITTFRWLSPDEI